MKPTDRRPPLTRRQFLASAAAAGLAAKLTGACTSGEPGGGHRTAPADPASSDGQSTIGRVVAGQVDGRVLLVVNLPGGNDGLSTLVPADDPIYHQLRPNLAVDAASVIPIDDRVGLAPELALLAERGLTIVEGVGPINGDLSHFAMTERWVRGDVRGNQAFRTGFFGRLADALDDGSPLVGVSLAGPTPALLTERAGTLAFSGPSDFWHLSPNDDWLDARSYQAAVKTFDGDVGESFERLIDVASNLDGAGSLDGDEEIDWSQPMLAEGGELGHQLHLAADLIAADVGTRVIVASYGDFDTHRGHDWRHPDLMRQLDAAVGGFLERADDLGIADRVLVATVSEFGRRVEENDNGLDHGSASTMLMAGPAPARLLGEPPDLSVLDDGNLATTVGFDRYLATLAEDWLGVEAASVLPDEPETLGLF